MSIRRHALDRSALAKYAATMRGDDLRAYKLRWELVAARERAASERLDASEKFAQLAMLMSFARAQGTREANAEIEIEGVRKRWNLRVERLLG